MKPLTRFLFFLSILPIPTLVRAQQNFLDITKYGVYYGWAHNYPQDWMVLRRFENHNKEYYLLVNPQTLQTKVNESSFYQVKPMTLAEARTAFKNTPYEKAIRKAEKQSTSIQDAGIERGIPTEAGISLTADLCPSHKPLDRRIFTTIFTEFKKVEKPAPIALSVSGLWMLNHKEDLEWLKHLSNEGEIRITWIDHSYNHRVSKTAPLKENFLLEPGTDISYEVLATEQLMLKNGLVPSAFFRFPGLISDQQLVYKITDFGLIPIGSDAWLAKGQQPNAGSIVLIHGNGNEPVGVEDFIKLLRSKTKQIAKKQWLLYDLSESVDDAAESSK
ncbi:polysaccharide deacetylase [Mucilaginibacter sp. BT774]|uniref:polysaccharide deacetylase family protein n=1 Tax=Mucilaginibacter sp. BT774 TaxID=3062276 RepID=UPI002675D7C8|nr:polysaccharide deacetylase [Mucilaginibacter sp. BT774]MDO3625574.1 polysaccharide deacetylase [Mucilaginibacter sp. BT774]